MLTSCKAIYTFIQKQLWAGPPQAGPPLAGLPHAGPPQLRPLLVQLLLAMVLFLAPLVPGHAQQLNPVQKQKVLQDLNTEWFFWQENTRQYLPWVGTNGNRPYYIKQTLQARQLASFWLSLKVPAQTSVYVGNKLITLCPTDTVLRWPAQTLLAYANGQALSLGLYHPKGFTLQQVRLQLTRQQMVWPNQPLAPNLAGQPWQQKHQAFEAFLFLFFVLSMGLLALWAYLAPKPFNDIFTLNRLLSFRGTDEQVYRSTWRQGATLLWMLFYGAMLSCLLIIALYNLGPNVNTPLAWQSFNTLTLLGFWALGTLAAWLLMALKQLWLATLTALFNFKGFAVVHFVEYARLTQLFLLLATTAALVQLLWAGLYGPELFKWLFYAFLALWLLRTLLIYIRLLLQVSFRKIHLIAYLCTTEILPLFISLKLYNSL